MIRDTGMPMALAAACLPKIRMVERGGQPRRLTKAEMIEAAQLIDHDGLCLLMCMSNSRVITDDSVVRFCGPEWFVVL